MTTLPETAPLPELVRGYLARSLPPHPTVPVAVRVHQAGEMWKKPGARATAFQATEDFAVERVAFSWRARFPIVGPLAITVVDGFGDGGGQLRVSLLGIPLRTQTGPETNVGEAMRYLAELAWAPHAIAMNRKLEWRDAGERTVEVACQVDVATVAVRWEACGPSQSERHSCRRSGAATSASTRASPTHAYLRSARRGGSYPRAASSTGVGVSRHSSWSQDRSGHHLQDERLRRDPAEHRLKMVHGWMLFPVRAARTTAPIALLVTAAKSLSSRSAM